MVAISIGGAKTKLNLRSAFHALYTHALRWNFTRRNPIALVRQSGSRRSTPRILTAHEIGLLLMELDEVHLGLPCGGVLSKGAVGERRTLFCKVPFPIWEFTPR